MGLSVTGTIGVLVETALKGLIDFDEVIGVLTAQTNFRAGDVVIAAARRRLASIPR
jgi:predicted nucleic acid-binding protein